MKPSPLHGKYRHSLLRGTNSIGARKMKKFLKRLTNKCIRRLAKSKFEDTPKIVTSGYLD